MGVWRIIEIMDNLGVFENKNVNILLIIMNTILSSIKKSCLSWVIQIKVIIIFYFIKNK